jgi:hypothetical protein
MEDWDAPGRMLPASIGQAECTAGARSPSWGKHACAVDLLSSFIGTDGGGLK